MKLMRTVFPWLIAVFIFYFLFRKYPFRDVIAATQYVRLEYFIPLAVVYFMFIWVSDSWGLAKIFKRFNIKIHFNELLSIRLASYLVSIVNYGAGQAALAYFCKKHKSVPFSDSSSVVIYTAIIDFYWALSIGFAGTFLYSPVVVGSIDITSFIRILWAGATVGLVALWIFWRLPIDLRHLHWLRARNLFHTFHKSRPRDYLYVLLLRFPIHIALNSYFYFLALTYGVHVPLLKVVSLFPIVTIVSTIPITPSGIGTAQFAAVALFQSHISGQAVSQGAVSAPELILSMSLFFAFSNYFLKAVTGVFFIKKIMRA